MARMILLGFPDAPVNEQWCALCVALAKGDFFADPDVREKVEKGLADEDSATFTIRGPRSATHLLQHLNIAVTHATCQQMGLAVVPLCWLHAPVIDGGAPPRELPRRPGLFRGPSGVN
jgi:hypothetical protein